MNDNYALWYKSPEPDSEDSDFQIKMATRQKKSKGHIGLRMVHWLNH